MTEEEAFILTVYSLLLFRMLNIYSMLKKQTNEYRKKHRRGMGMPKKSCLEKIIGLQNWIAAGAFFLQTGLNIYHYIVLSKNFEASGFTILSIELT
jgi:hypothetical protein